MTDLQLEIKQRSLTFMPVPEKQVSGAAFPKEYTAEPLGALKMNLEALRGVWYSTSWGRLHPMMQKRTSGPAHPLHNTLPQEKSYRKCFPLCTRVLCSILALTS